MWWNWIRFIWLVIQNSGERWKYLEHAEALFRLV